MHYFDNYGWLSLAEIPGRSTDVAPGQVPAERVVGQPWPNLVGDAWVMLSYSEPSAQPEPPKAPRLVTVGAFFDRFGGEKWPVLSDQSPLVKAIILDKSVRTVVDLDDPDLPGALAIIIAAGHEIDADAFLDAPVQPHEVP